MGDIKEPRPLHAKGALIVLRGLLFSGVRGRIESPGGVYLMSYKPPLTTSLKEPQ
jgi:hypothetical protein